VQRDCAACDNCDVNNVLVDIEAMLGCEDTLRLIGLLMWMMYCMRFLA